MITKTLEISWGLEKHITDHSDKWHYSEAMADEFLLKVSKYNACVTWLCNHFHEIEGDNGRYFHYTIKNHMLLHCAWLSRYINPIRTWCYQARLERMPTRLVV